MARQGSRIFRYGRDSGEVLLGGGAPRAWRLEMREDSNDRGMFVFSARERRERRRAQRIGYYMFAGGMRQHAHSGADTLQTLRKRAAVRIMLALAALWLAFRWLPLD